MIGLEIAELGVLIVSAILIIPQIFLLKKQMHDSHEEKRRENTIKFMLEWCNSVKKDTNVAEQVARKLTNEQCQKLYKHEQFRVDVDLKKEICKFCPLSNGSCDDCSLKNDDCVDGKILTELRWHVITYLNTVETLLIAWNLGIVDKNTIEEQFKFLGDTSKGSTLDQFRNAAGGYPVTEEFIDAIKERPTQPKKEL